MAKSNALTSDFKSDDNQPTAESLASIIARAGFCGRMLVDFVHRRPSELEAARRIALEVVVAGRSGCAQLSLDLPRDPSELRPLIPLPKAPRRPGARPGRKNYFVIGQRRTGTNG